jgi:hypothetical protein
MYRRRFFSMSVIEKWERILTNVFRLSLSHDVFINQSTVNKTRLDSTC